MPAQLDMLDLLAPSPAWVVLPSLPRRRIVQTRAAQHGGEITVLGDDGPDPFEITVREIACVISCSGGFCTHAIAKAGSLFWSETGFCSFRVPTDEPSEIIAIVERYIEQPAKAGGCGGKLVRWWPGYVLQWRQSLGFELDMTKDGRGRGGVWAQWGSDRHVTAWQAHDDRLALAVRRMRADGIEPDEVGPPSGFRGKWPKVPA